MKYILVQTFMSSLVRKNICQKKNLAQKLENIFFCQNPFQAIQTKKRKKRRKVAWTTKPLV